VNRGYRCPEPEDPQFRRWESVLVRIHPAVLSAIGFLTFLAVLWWKAPDF
jgi:hypothetical protein